MSGSKQDIPHHIWGVILPYLRLPRPKPLSRPARSELRQPHLCAAARVCKVFHSAIVPILYSEIVVDSLSDLMAEVDVANPSSYRRFSYTQKLFIEYWRTGEDPPYAMTLDVGGANFWPFWGRMPDQADKTVHYDTLREAETLRMGLAVIEDVGGGKLFPNLAAISIASIYGKPNGRWLEFANSDRLSRQKFSECTRMFHSFLISAKSLKRICVRDSNGPLSIDPAPHGSNKPHFHQTLHFTSDIGQLWLPLGTPVRWSSDIPLHHDFLAVMYPLRDWFGRLLDVRAKPGYGDNKKDAADLEIFCSTSMTMVPESVVAQHRAQGQLVRGGMTPVSESDQRITGERLGADIQQSFRQASGAKDMIRWRASQDMPTCACCGSQRPM